MADHNMRLWLLSDLHLELAHPRSIQRLQAPECDAVIVAGDLDTANATVATARTLFGPDLPLILIAGNHSHYGTQETVNDGIRRMRAEAAQDREQGRKTWFLEDEATILRLNDEKVRFIGTTLWTDFRLYDDPQRYMKIAGMVMNDYSRIRGDNLRHALAPAETTEWHKRSRAFLAKTLRKRFAGKTVVVTHHMPSKRSVHPRYAGNPVTPAFASNCDDLLALGADLWVHGHTHASCDYQADTTRVICNPSGYGWGSGRLENPAFDPALVVEI